MRKFLVDFSLSYLRILAKIQLFKIRPVVVGIGGASGKSSVAHLLGLILKEKYTVLETRGKNSETGIPLSVLGLNVQNYTFFEWFAAFLAAPFKIILDWNKYDVLVAEMGIDGPSEPKNMTYLLKIIKPKIGALTNISYEHSVYFEEVSKDKKKILELTSSQEALLLKSLPRDGTAILNIDDSIIGKLTGIKASKISISAKSKSDFFIDKIESNLRVFKIEFFFENKKYELKLPHPLPSHYAYSLVIALAVANVLGVVVKDSIKILKNNFSLPAGRMSVFEGKKDTIIIDSSYNNATLAPVIDLLDFLKKSAGKRKKVIVLGDMRELGVVSKDYHEKVAHKLLTTTDLVFLIGPLSQKFIKPILIRKKHKFYSFNTFSEAKESIKSNIEKGDIILVKSSQNTLFLERVVEMLLKNPSDIKNLARRGRFWDKKRSQSL